MEWFATAIVVIGILGYRGMGSAISIIVLKQPRALSGLIAQHHRIRVSTILVSVCIVPVVLILTVMREGLGENVGMAIVVYVGSLLVFPVLYVLELIAYNLLLNAALTRLRDMAALELPLQPF